MPMPPALADGEKAPPKEKPQKAGRNGPCPCGSGKKYKKCCLLKQREHERAVREARRRPRRERTPPRPKSGAVAGEFIPVTEPQFDEDATVTAMKNAGVKPEVIYAFQKTGRFIAPESRQMYDEETLAEWDAAIEEYEADGEETDVSGEAAPPPSASADEGE
jgi:hypothetical protein